jgi:hypothetical protein
MKGNEGHWGGEISIISQNFPKPPSILFHPLESSISQTSPEGSRYIGLVLFEEGLDLFLLWWNHISGCWWYY